MTTYKTKLVDHSFKSSVILMNFQTIQLIKYLCFILIILYFMIYLYKYYSYFIGRIPVRKRFELIMTIRKRIDQQEHQNRLKMKKKNKWKCNY